MNGLVFGWVQSLIGSSSSYRNLGFKNNFSKQRGMPTRLAKTGLVCSFLKIILKTVAR
jgi:hypothetical protein